MAKKKKSAKTKKGLKISEELTGLILILLGIIGMGFGPIGKFVKEFAIFLAGELFFVVLLIVLIVGFYMLFMRKLPKFFSARMVGLYLIILVLLTVAHLKFIENSTNFADLLHITTDNFMKRIDTIPSNGQLFASGDNTIIIGGGIIGALTSGLLSTCFGYKGTIIVTIIVTIFALILVFNVTLSDIFNKIKNLFSKDNDEDDEDEDEDEKENNEENEDDDDKSVGLFKKQKKQKYALEDIVTMSIDEIKNVDVEKIENVEEVKEEINEFNPEMENDSSEYRLPKIELLAPLPKKKKVNDLDYIENNKKNLISVLNDFDIKASIVDMHIGPAVTEYEIKVPNGTKVNRITNINKEIALAMAAKDVRIQAPIPGKSTIGIEIPNREISSVVIREVLEETVTEKTENKILVALGKDIMGKSIVTDLSKMPHLLVAGSTGSGKSVCINGIICSILMKYKPNEVKLILVDPKKVELTNYNHLPHLLCPVVTDPKKASATLQKAVQEMDNRFNLFADKGVKNITGYNEMVEKNNKKHPDSPMQKMPYLVIIIDELADLMLIAAKEVQDSIMRITQLARAAGIHLIVATQRPSTDIITGVIKNNIPSRIAFAVSSSIDSRTILDTSGADKLLGKGDMLFLPMGENIPVRIQGCFISDNEINKLTEYCKAQASAKYNSDFENLDSSSSSINNAPGSSFEGGANDEPMYNEIVDFAMKTGKISASLIQRRFHFGYNRAARVIDLLEERGIIGPQNGSKPREVLKKDESNEES